MTAKKSDAETAEDKEIKAAKKQELKAKQVWESLPGENPFENPVQVLIADVKKNSADALWVKCSLYLPNTGSQPFKYMEEGEFRDLFPKLVSPQ